MWGAILGDIAGSMYEFNPIRNKTFELFQSECEYTDDSVCTAAVADILLHGKPPAETLQAWCRRHPGRGYGGSFVGWISQENPTPYDSYGNGSAMRVSAAAHLNRTNSLAVALHASDLVTEVSHNHPEGMKGARATTHAIWMAYQGETVDTIRDTISTTYAYDLDRSVDEIRPSYYFNEICQQTVPEAIICALESTSYEDAIRNAISLGGDADTLAAIAGPIAEVLHGLPDATIQLARDRFLAEAADIAEAIDALY